MKRILEEFYLGNLRPAEHGYANKPKYQKLSMEVTDLYESLSNKLSDEDYAIAEKILDLHDQAERLLAQEHYISGFRTGMRMAIESIYDGEPVESKEMHD